ncbi:chromate efflux transporter [Opitutus sp. ER46]|uniref:chromate efflux transporter n=1 Tax=Opitutus sp. ER46 TaxID=2161864 RepID=UPI000D3022C0|nr:chromate efflux transporter [Opitutus sp. ER46]PTX95649.1 chromate transporter [Opitutus sp. ER46]
MSDARAPTFAEAVRFWLKLGFISFGGPTGQIAIMHTELVERRRWIGEQRFLHALNYCMLLPGPEATQLATYCGWLLHRTWGGIVAGVLFVLPSVVLLWALSYVYVVYGTVPAIAAVFAGLKPAVTAIVVAAVIRLGRRALRTRVMWLIAAAAFGLIFFLKVPFPAIVGGAALVGFALRWTPWAPVAPTEAGGANGTNVAAPAGGYVIDDAAAAAAHTRPSWGRALKVVAVSVALWWAPIVAAGLWQGWHGTLAQEGVFFSKAAMVTFGGAYAVLPYVGQQAVEHFDWITAPQMLDGLGLAETTPGPLIMVVQFVGFLGGWQHPGGLSSLLAATLGALITTWATFVPCFLWIFLGAPHIEQLRGQASLSRMLSAVTAAVVGVVLNLAVWFGLHVFFPSGLAGGRIDGFAVVVCALAFVALQFFKVGIVPVVLVSGLIGFLWA